MDNPKIYIAFRFHVNFNHSYRGNTPDENGFGKDIRIIRHIIDTLNDYNSKGIDVCGTWDADNYFSLQNAIPEHSPDLIESWKKRLESGRDEFQIMSYNNGLISAHTAREFEEVIKRSISNHDKSGIKDIFGSYEPMVRPQEMMFTPIQLKAYQQHGIESISLFNSALPFNTFSNFIPPLSLVERFNPLTLKYEGIEETLTLIPAYNTGDLVDNISLLKWVKKIRKQQLELHEPTDLMVLVDMDADDDFWIGMDFPLVNKVYSSLQGLSGLVDSLDGLDFIEYTTPGKYLKEHDTIRTIEIRQDTADGSFDGYSSWAEKWSNQRLWTGIERSRLLELQTRRVLELVNNKGIAKEVDALLESSYEERIKSFSTTHFGLSTPIMNASRLQIAQNIVRGSVDQAFKAFGVAEIFYNESRDAESFSLVDYKRGQDTDVFKFQSVPSKSLVKLRLQNIPEDKTGCISLVDDSGNEVPHIMVYGVNEQGEKRAQLYFLESFEPYEKKDYKLIETDELENESAKSSQRALSANILENSDLTCRFDDQNNVVGLIFRGHEFIGDNGFNTAITYARHRTDANEWKDVEFNTTGAGQLMVRRQRTELLLKAAGGKKVEVKRQFKIAESLPYLYVDMSLKYPITSFQKYSRERAERLGKAWDGNWIEIMPCELVPTFFGTSHNHLKVWKHNYFGHVSSYQINYADFSKNHELDAFNNQITNGWVAVSDGTKGLLIAQTVETNSSFAFCPMRTRKTGGETNIHLNPFGTYFGRQFKYPTAVTGLGKMGAFMTSDHLDPLAPSYNGKKQCLSLMIAPYKGDEPPREVQNDAMAFAYPYLLLTKSDLIKDPECRNWKP